MYIKEARFISSVARLDQCPTPDRHEFAFIGRSNVGKSSLLNMLLSKKGLAKVSQKPGKTQTINHFLVNEKFYLVDLPGYGYASVSKDLKAGFGKMIDKYVTKRSNLDCLFVLLDGRLTPQRIDLDFILWAGEHGVPIALIFTKTDKLSGNELAKSMKVYEKKFLEIWEELPPNFVSSAETGRGKDEILNFMQTVMTESEENK
ncbi:MAG: ribosome biogenesis GTP-binding protein YihA/YsxC [Cyclobacteriaceae bacterium]|nr:ribosome biogenesis GTP-binding protein YihA/YsxC [Cyclobacteriaceae bacterium]